MDKIRTLFFISLLIIGISCSTGCEKNNSNEEDMMGNSTSQIEKFDFSGKYVGDYITFGEYEQDNNNSNGKEDIEWLVLDKEDGKIFVLSRYILEFDKYHKKDEAVTWETSSIRSWLNTEFLYDAFEDSERAIIPIVDVENDNNWSYGTNGGEPTRDKVFLLSFDEVKNYLPYSSERICAATDYVLGKDGFEAWWLRTPGYDSYRASEILYDGYINDYSDPVYWERGVRPAMWINIK